MSDSQSKAIGTIRSEHRSLAAVIHNMRELLNLANQGKQPLDFPLFWSMVYYIDAFPDVQHHPKEDNWLFARLKLRTREADALITQLEADHQEEAQSLGQIRRYLGNLEAGVPRSIESLDHALSRYADFTWRHLRMEEQELMPLAELHLLPSDWDDIADAFSSNQDPLALEQAETFHEHFRAIVNRTPAPLGFGGN